MTFNYAEHLPIYERRSEIVESIVHNQVTIVAGETGSGKTTQLPLMCLEAGRGSAGRIGCTQPRRIAAVSIAEHVARLLGSEPGKDVGYKVRFRDSLDKNAKVKFMTDGILLAEIAGDPLLKQYSTLIIDEAHERSINVDFLLGYLRTVLSRRPDLRLVISSATMDTGLFSRCFNHAPVIEVSGRLFDVETIYKPAIELWQGESIDGYIEGVVTSVREIVENGQDGDILVFLPTIQDINETIARLRPTSLAHNCTVLPLHSRLAVTEQSSIFHHRKQRTIVVATNIAETSITVPGIRFVIDSGLARTLRYEPSARISRMPIERISRASADQRRGRCGRVRDGVCIRLYGEQDYLSRPAFTSPEMKRANLAGVMLRMAYLRLGKAEKFPFLQRPSTDAMREGFRQLRELGAFDQRGHLTKLGYSMGRFPLDPPVSRMLLDARSFGAVREVAIIAAALSVEDPRLHPSDAPDRSIGSPNRLRHPESDFLTFVQIWNAFYSGGNHSVCWPAVKAFCKDNGLSFLRVREWVDAHDQIGRICRGMRDFVWGNKPATYEAVHKSLLGGLVGNIASSQGNRLYTGVNVPEIMIFPGSTLFRREPAWVLFHEIVETNRIYGRTAASIRPEWVEHIFRHECQYRYQDAHYDEQTGTVRCREEVVYHGLLLIRNRHVDLAVKDRSHAHDVFIKEALVGEMAGRGVRFIEHNRQIRIMIEQAQHKLRNTGLYAGDWALECFYDENLPSVTSLRELHERIREKGSNQFLFIAQDQLLASPLPDTLADFPDTITVAGHTLEVRYLFAPGNDNDGVTIEVPELLFEATPQFYWEWLPAGLVRSKIAILVGALDDEITGAGFDPAALTHLLMQQTTSSQGAFLVALCRAIGALTGLDLRASEIPSVLLPEHLWPRIRVRGERGIVKEVFRTPITDAKRHATSGMRHRIWEPFCRDWEIADVGRWTEGDVAKRVQIQPLGQSLGITGYPALTCENGRVAVRTYFSREHALAAHEQAVGQLLESALAEELLWNQHKLQLSPQLRRGLAAIDNRLADNDTIIDIVHRRIMEVDRDLPTNPSEFGDCVAAIRASIASRSTAFVAVLQEIVNEHTMCRDLIKKIAARHSGLLYNALLQELQESLDTYSEWLVSGRASGRLIDRLPRYLRGLQRRIEMALVDPGKYRTRMAAVNRYRTRAAQVSQALRNDALPVRAALENAWDLIEEFSIAQFAQQQAKAKDRVTEAMIESGLDAVAVSLGV